MKKGEILSGKFAICGWLFKFLFVSKLRKMYFFSIVFPFIFLDGIEQLLKQWEYGYRVMVLSEWAFVRANYLPLIFSTKEVLIIHVSKHRHKDNNINFYERRHKNGKAACAYKRFTH